MKKLLVWLIALIFLPELFMILVFIWLLSVIAPLFEGTPSDIGRWWDD